MERMDGAGAARASLRWQVTPVDGKLLGSRPGQHGLVRIDENSAKLQCKKLILNIPGLHVIILGLRWYWKSPKHLHSYPTCQGRHTQAHTGFDEIGTFIFRILTNSVIQVAEVPNRGSLNP